jgi:hypothetical protein
MDKSSHVDDHLHAKRARIARSRCHLIAISGAR